MNVKVSVSSIFYISCMLPLPLRGLDELLVNVLGVFLLGTHTHTHTYTHTHTHTHTRVGGTGSLPKNFAIELGFLQKHNNHMGCVERGWLLYQARPRHGYGTAFHQPQSKLMNIITMCTPAASSLALSLRGSGEKDRLQRTCVITQRIHWIRYTLVFFRYTLRWRQVRHCSG